MGEPLPLENKKALVTGGSGDIGRAVATALAEAGADVGITYVRFQEGADKTMACIAENGRKGKAVRLDQRDTQEVERAIDETANALGGLDILVNNAAWNIGIPYPDIEALNPDVWDRVMETNLRGPYLLARAAAGLLRKGDGGAIVNIASTAGISPSGSSIAYACSKAGVIHLTKCLAVALAPKVQVNCVAPGLVEGTRMAERLPGGVANSERAQAVLGRVGAAEDVARQVVAFCLSGTVTGQTIAIDGGKPGAMR